MPPSKPAIPVNASASGRWDGDAVAGIPEAVAVTEPGSAPPELPLAEFVAALAGADVGRGDPDVAPAAAGAAVVGRGSAIAKNTWSAVAVELFVDTRTVHAPGEPHENNASGLSPTNGVKA